MALCVRCLKILLLLSYLLLICFKALPQTWSRKYNVEAESLRLYGEDFQAVLRKFRRTPEYLQLLKEKTEHIVLLYKEVFQSAQQYVIENRLKKKVALLCGLEDYEHFEIYLPEVRDMKSAYGMRDGEELIPENMTILHRLSPIEILDDYVISRSTLSTKEKNKIKEIGFETSGETIHMIIRGMGPLEFRSTRQPFGGELGKHIRTTTERDHRHVIATQAPPFSHEDQTLKPEPSDFHNDETLRSSNNKI